MMPDPVPNQYTIPQQPAPEAPKPFYITEPVPTGVAVGNTPFGSAAALGPDAAQPIAPVGNPDANLGQTPFGNASALGPEATSAPLPAPVIPGMATSEAQVMAPNIPGFTLNPNSEQVAQMRPAAIGPDVVAAMAVPNLPLNFGGNPAPSETITQPQPVIPPTSNIAVENLSGMPSAEPVKPNLDVIPDSPQALTTASMTPSAPTSPEATLTPAPDSAQAAWGATAPVNEDIKSASSTENLGNETSPIATPEQILKRADNALKLPQAVNDPGFKNAIYKAAETAMAQSFLSGKA